MNPHEAYRLFTTLRLHFTTEYDIIKYHGKLKRIPDFRKINDKYAFSKLARHADPKGLILANLVYDPKIWVRKLFDVDAQKRYMKWQKYREGLLYHFSEEIKHLDQNAFRIEIYQHPEALKKYLKGEVSLDTLVIMDDFIKFVNKWDEKLNYDPMWSNVSGVIKKYQPFIQYDKVKIKEILKRWLHENP